jgi:hypothetical protein
LPNAILARAFERAAAGLVAPSDGSVDVCSARVPMSYVARRGDPAAIGALARFLSDAYAEVASWSGRPIDSTIDIDTTDKEINRHSSVVLASELLLVAGASHGLDVACAALTKPGDVVVVETPTYFLAADVFADRGLRVVGVAGATCETSTDDSSFDVDALERRLENGLRPRLVYVVPTHSNPRSGTMSLEKRKRLLRLARRHDFYVVADEVYHLLSWGKGEDAPPPRFREVEREMRLEEGREEATGTTSDEMDDPYFSSPAEDENKNANAQIDEDSVDSRVVSLGSFSKILAPGMRLGWIEAGHGLIRTLADRGYLSSGGSVSPLAASVATAVINAGRPKNVFIVFAASVRVGFRSFGGRGGKRDGVHGVAHARRALRRVLRVDRAPRKVRRRRVRARGEERESRDASGGEVRGGRSRPRRGGGVRAVRSRVFRVPGRRRDRGGGEEVGTSGAEEREGVYVVHVVNVV